MTTVLCLCNRYSERNGNLLRRRNTAVRATRRSFHARAVTLVAPLSFSAASHGGVPDGAAREMDGTLDALIAALPCKKRLQRYATLINMGL